MGLVVQYGYDSHQNELLVNCDPQKKLKIINMTGVGQKLRTSPCIEMDAHNSFFKRGKDILFDFLLCQFPVVMCLLSSLLWNFFSSFFFLYSPFVGPQLQVKQNYSRWIIFFKLFDWVFKVRALFKSALEQRGWTSSLFKILHVVICSRWS